MSKSRIVMPVVILLATITMTGCWETTEEGTVKVQTVYGRINRVIKAQDGGVWTITTLGDEYYPVSLRTETSSVQVGASSKDNAALNIQIAVTFHVVNTDESVMNYVRRFGLDEAGRHQRRNQIIEGQVNTETKNAVANFNAYEILANQEAIQRRIFETLTPLFAQQLLLEVESVQIIGRPDFLDDRIEQAASAVVAYQREREAAQARLETARVDAERQVIEARTYENPAMLELRRLELQRQIAEAWARHQGTLVLGGNTQTQIPTTTGR